MFTQAHGLLNRINRYGLDPKKQIAVTGLEQEASDKFFFVSWAWALSGGHGELAT